VSYGLTQQLYNYWRKAGYQPLYLRQVSARGASRGATRHGHPLQPTGSSALAASPNSLLDPLIAPASSVVWPALQPSSWPPIPLRLGLGAHSSSPTASPLVPDLLLSPDRLWLGLRTLIARQALD
jgi:hypothetical protein